MSCSGIGGSELAWAEEASRRNLEPLGSRWRHTLGVVERARGIGGVLRRSDPDVLVAAAYLHDIGYAPELSRTGFHQLDGARFVRDNGHERVAGLVAYHSGAVAEADERWLLGELWEFEDERSLLSRALTYCDLTTDAQGRLVGPVERIAEVRQRYGPAAPEARALARSETALLDDVGVVESMLAGDDRSSGGRTETRRRAH